MQSLGPSQSLKLSSVARPLAIPGASPTYGVAELTADAAVGHPPGVGALGGVTGCAVIPAAGEVAVLTGLSGDGPAVPSPWMVDNKPEWHAVTVLDAVRPAAAEVVAASERLLPLGFLLLLLYLSNLDEIKI